MGFDSLCEETFSLHYSFFHIHEILLYWTQNCSPEVQLYWYHQQLFEACESLCAQILDSFYIYRYGSQKLDSTRMIQRKRKKTIFRGNVGRLWSIFHSFDRLPLQDNDEKMLEGEKKNSTGRKRLKYDAFHLAGLHVLHLTHPICS